MNRSILIVICDFLVSSMLAMMTGMVPAHTGGTGVGLDEQTTRAMLAEMHANLDKLERARELLRESVRKNGGATPEQARRLRELAAQIVALRRDSELLAKGRDNKGLAKLTAKQLQTRLEAEVRARMRAEMELKEHSSDLAARNRELSELRQDFSNTSRAVAELTRGHAELNRDIAKLTRSNAELTKSNTELAKTNTELTRGGAATRRELEQARGRLDKSQQELRRAEKALGEEKSQRRIAETRLDETSQEVRRRGEELAASRRRLNDLAYQFGKSREDSAKKQGVIIALSSKNNDLARQLASLQDRYEKLRGEKEQLSRERDNARKAQQDMQKQTETAVRDLSKAKTELMRKDVELAEARTEIKGRDDLIKAKDETIREQKQLNRRHANRAIQNYGAGLVKLDVAISEARAFGKRSGSDSFYLPLVDVGGRSYLIGHLDQFLGGKKTPMTYHRVVSVSMFASVPGQKHLGRPLPGPVLLAGIEPQLAAVPLGISGRKPLKGLTAPELRNWGAEGLYLFKAGTPGRDYASLNDRCTFDVERDVLLIRNSGSRSELRAEPGDLVLTSAGDFAALIVDIDRMEGSRRRGDVVRAVALPDAKVWNSPRMRIPYGKPRDAEFCTAFEEAVDKIKRELEAKRR